MRERILASLRLAAERGEIAPSRWRELRDRTGDIAVSTIDAFCLSLLREFPLEADLDPGFSMADETEVPRLIDESLDRALRACRAVAREDDNVALVFAQLGDRRAKAGLAALLSRRLVAPEDPAPLPRPGAGRVDGGDGRRARRGVAPRRLRRHARRARRLPRVGSRHSRLPAAGRRAAGDRDRRRCARRRGGARRVLARARVFSDAGRHAPQGARAWREEGGVPHERRLRAPPRSGDRTCAGRGGRARRLSPRSQRAGGARRVADVRHCRAPLPRHARRARGPRFSRRAAVHAAAAPADGGVLAEPLPAGVALSPRARGRVPGHEPGAVGAGVAAGAGLGRRRRGWPIRGRSSRRSSSSATASSRSTGSAMPTSRCWARRAAPSPGCGPAATSGARSRAVSGRCRRCWRSSTTSAPISTRRRPGPTPLRSARTTCFRSTATRSAPTPALGMVAVRGRRGMRGRDRRGDCRARRQRRHGARPRDRRAPAGAAGRRRHPVPDAREPPRVRGRRWPAWASRRTSTRAWASSTRTRSRICWRCSGISPIRRRTCAPPRSCARGSSGSPTRGCGGSRPGWPRPWPLPIRCRRTAPLDDVDAGAARRGAHLVRALAGARRPHPAGRTDRSRAPRVGLRRGASRAAPGPGAREPQEIPGAAAAHPEPRLRHPRAHRVASRPPGGRATSRTRRSTPPTP